MITFINGIGSFNRSSSKLGCLLILLLVVTIWKAVGSFLVLLKEKEIFTATQEMFWNISCDVWYLKICGILMLPLCFIMELPLMFLGFVIMLVEAVVKIPKLGIKCSFSEAFSIYKWRWSTGKSMLHILGYDFPIPVK